MEQGIIKQFVNAIKQDPKEKKTTYSAIVSRIDEEGVIWVYVAGADKDTPTAQTGVEVRKGDHVTVEWQNNKLYIAGNYSNPSAGVVRVAQVELASKVANEAAKQAVSDAGRAREAAESAQEDAVKAQESAGIAKDAADDALKGLGKVEDVVGVLDWITAHSKVTEDTTPKAGKSYYIKRPDGTFVLVTEVEGKNPHEEGWYELDEAIQNYIMSHLALTDDGLYVMKDGSQWKVLIANDGVYILDPDDNPVAQYKDHVIIGNEKSQHIDIRRSGMRLYDPEGSETFRVLQSDTPTISRSELLFKDEYTLHRTGFELYENSESFNIESAPDDEQIHLSNLIINIRRADSETIFDGNTSSLITTGCEAISFDETEITIKIDDQNFEKSRSERRIVSVENIGTTRQGRPAKIFVEVILTPTTFMSEATIEFRFTIKDIEEWVKGYICDIYDGLISWTVESYAPSLRFGTSPDKNGAFSASLGESLYASGDNQIAVGKYNTKNIDNIFAVGNGESDTERHDAFSIRQDGTIVIDVSPMRDFVVEQEYYGQFNEWLVRKWKSGLIEAWYEYEGGSATYTPWASPIRYRDIEIAIPSGIFTAAPLVTMMSSNNQIWVVSAVATSTKIYARLATVSSSAVQTKYTLYCVLGL